MGYMGYAPFFVRGVEKRKGKEREEYIKFHVGRWGKRSFSFPGSKVHVMNAQNIPSKGPYIIIANHQSMLDITLIQGYLNAHTGFIAKKELGKFFTVGSFLKILGGELIDRENPREAVLAIENLVKRMKDEDQVIAIFPEGTRSTDGEIHEFKAGAMKIVTKAKVSILPVAISGTEKSMPRGSLYIKKSEIYLSILPLIEVEEFNELSTKEISDLVREKISSEVHRIRSLGR
jgi:1-acyl-sn-glycerol-3-phosphate acyltransferase